MAVGYHEIRLSLSEMVRGPARPDGGISQKIANTFGLPRRLDSHGTCSGRHGSGGRVSRLRIGGLSIPAGSRPNAARGERVLSTTRSVIGAASPESPLGRSPPPTVPQPGSRTAMRRSAHSARLAL